MWHEDQLDSVAASQADNRYSEEYSPIALSQPTQPLNKSTDFTWNKTLSTCGLWNCPFEAPDHPSEKEECLVCRKEVPNRALLPCGTCKHSACVLCLLQTYANRAVQRNRFRCCFCRQKFNNRAIQQLLLFYDGHKHSLPVQLTTAHQLSASPSTASLESHWTEPYVSFVFAHNRRNYWSETPRSMYLPLLPRQRESWWRRQLENAGQERMAHPDDPGYHTLYHVHSSVWSDPLPTPPPGISLQPSQQVGQEVTIHRHQQDQTMYDVNPTLAINHLHRNNFVQRQQQMPVHPSVQYPSVRSAPPTLSATRNAAFTHL